MSWKLWFRLIFFWGVCCTDVDCEYALFECPFGWDEYLESCYRFVRDPLAVGIDTAKVSCAHDGAHVVAVNTEGEHIFMVQKLDEYDVGATKLDWWTSGQRVNSTTADFFWEGDGTKVDSFFAWQDPDIPSTLGLDHIIYNYDGYEWSWITAKGTEELPYICEISKEDIYKIIEEDRGPGYGVDNPDPETIERGPSFVVEPLSTIYEPTGVYTYAWLDCEVDAYPSPFYQWTKERGNQIDEIDPSEDSKYTMINGKLLIHYPQAENADDGRYQCRAANDFGSILSNIADLTFGYLQDFPKSPRSPVTAVSYQFASIECSPPPHYPDVLYTWYKNDIWNFIRPDLKPYLFISHDGRLYFSEVTADDIGNYYCMIYKPGQDLAEGKISMPTELKVVEGSPGIYEPQIDSRFPLTYPNNPVLGDNVRIECFASGTSNPPLVYHWDKIQMEDGKEKVLPLPNNAFLSDHDRVITIYNVQPYDAGLYKCTVRRVHGQSASATTTLTLRTPPFFTLELKDQFVDVGTELRWRCEAGGSGITYTWLRNTVELNNDTLWDPDRVSISNNLLTISQLKEEVDDGMYQCAASNPHGKRYTSAQLKVLSFPPSFSKYPLQPNQFATVNGNTSLLCRPEAAPYPEYEAILWYKNGQELNPGSEEGDRLRKMPNGNLFISPVWDTDSGVYMCKVSNIHGEASTTGNLTVLSTVSLTQKPYDETIPVNHTRFLHCYASYDPKLDVTYAWFQGEMLIEFERIYRLGENRYEVWYNPHFKRGSGIYNGGLYIMNSQFYHKGKYKCVVESTSDSLEAEADVQITGPPSQPAGVFYQDATVTTSSVIVQWKAGNSNGNMIKSYVVEGLNYWQGFWKVLMTNIQVEHNDGTMTVNVTDLRPDSVYKIRMRAENDYGTSDPSEETQQFTTSPVLPDKYPEQVGGGGGKVGDLVITWKPLDPWDHNGPNIRYKISWKNKGDADWDEQGKETKGNVNRYVVLVGETNFYREYEVAVQAANDLGDGPLSPTVTIRSAMALPPATAENIRAEPFNSTAALVHWDPVEDSREHIKGKLGGYRVSFWKECCETEEMAPRVTIHGQASSGLVIGLYPDTAYYFDVMVWNEAGNGPKSQWIIQRTLRQAPIDMPVEVQIDRLNDHSIQVNWRGVSTTQTQEPLEGYKVRVWYDGEHIKDAKDYNADKETDLYIDDLNPLVTYKLRVFGYSRGGDGAMSSPTLKFELGSACRLQISAASFVLCFLLTYLVPLMT